MYLLAWLFLMGQLSACDMGQGNTETIIVTEIAIEGENQIVTRLVRQTVAITATPDVDAIQSDPVQLDLSYIGNLPNINPVEVTEGNSLDLVQNLFVGLTNYNHRQHIIEPELATDWSISPDGLTWTFTLRDDVFWVQSTQLVQSNRSESDVELIRPVVATDVAYSLEQVCRQDIETPNAFLLFIIQGCEQLYKNPLMDADILQVRAINNFELEIVLTKPASYFLTMTSLPLFYPVPAERVEEMEEAWTEAENLVTSGPFFPRTLTDSRVVLHRNPFWPESLRPLQGNISIVNILFLSEEMDAFELWQGKSLDVSPLPAEVQVDFLNSARTMFVTEHSVFYLAYNFDSPVFREQEMRQAFSAAIDREQIVTEIFDENAMSMRHLTPSGIVGGVPPDEVGLGYSPGDADQFINESGFRSCRLMPPITILVSTSDVSLRRAELIREMWAEHLGCTDEQIVIEQAEFGLLLANTRVDSGATRPDMWELGWASYYPDAHNWIADLLHCTESENRSNRPCSEVDDWIREASVTIDPIRRKELYRAIENRFFGRDGIVPIIPLYASGDYIVVQSWMIDYVPALFGGERYDTYQLDATLKWLERSR